jgi:hypothetical protein
MAGLITASDFANERNKAVDAGSLQDWSKKLGGAGLLQNYVKTAGEDYQNRTGEKSIDPRFDGHDKEGSVVAHEGSQFQKDMPHIQDLIAQGYAQGGQFSEKNPLEGQRYLDETSQGILDSQTERNLAGNNDYYKGIDPQFGANPQSIATKGAEGALEGRAKQDFDRGLGRLKRDAAFQQPAAQSEKIAGTTGQLTTNEQLRIQNYKEQAQYVIQAKQHNENLAAMKDANKKSLLGTILGGIGSVIGAVATGGASLIPDAMGRAAQLGKDLD